MKGLGWGIEGSFDGLVFGVDEAGRGPWAGPVMAAAVCLMPTAIPEGLADSKRLSPKRREALAIRLAESAAVAVAEASVEEIDRLNIRVATHLAMLRAIRALAQRVGQPAMVLVDGRDLPPMSLPAQAIVRGDGSVASIAAAGIMAKVSRDRLMDRLDRQCPGYGWATNRGYGTAVHAEALDRLGVTVHHRRSFAPVRKIFSRVATASDTIDCG